MPNSQLTVGRANKIVRSTVGCCQTAAEIPNRLRSQLGLPPETRIEVESELSDSDTERQIKWMLSATSGDWGGMQTRDLTRIKKVTVYLSSGEIVEVK